MHAFVAVHAGAGTCKKSNASRLKQLCETACKTALRGMEGGYSALQAVCFAVGCLEDDPLTNAGLGSNLTRDGTVECDASIMDGQTGRFGACGAVSNIKNPVLLARSILHNQRSPADSPLGLIPPMLLVGAGAEKFARSHPSDGIGIIDGKCLVTEEKQLKFNKYIKFLKPWGVAVPNIPEPEDEMDLDTVGAIAVDCEGNVAVAASSGGILLKYSGRIGQSALMGAGIWCEEIDNEAVACCTSGTGEHLIQTNLARELCRGISLDKSAFMSDLVADKFFLSGKRLPNDRRFLGVLLLQTTDWKSTGSGFLHVVHNTPTFCWATASSKNPTAKAEMSYSPATPDCSGPPPVITLGFSI